MPTESEDDPCKMPASIAYFISPHGFGHAARSAAIMAAIHRQQPQLRFEIFTRVPQWFFADSLPGPYSYHPLLTDIGLAQTNSLHENIDATRQRLNDFLPFDAVRLEQLAGQLHQLNCRLIICDIAPLGVAVAQTAGLPSILIENFTWDWIYRGYLSALDGGQRPQWEQHIAYLHGWFEQADFRIQAEPVCVPSPAASLTTRPISRQPRTPPEEVRRQLRLPVDAPIVIITMGGVAWQYTFCDRLQTATDYFFIVPNGGEKPERRGNLILLPTHSSFFHPDLMNAADAVITKVGYSSLAEVYRSGAPLGYIPRPQFPESPVLVDYIRQNMPGLPITEAEFVSGDWLTHLPDLLAQPRIQQNTVNGAEQAAEFIINSGFAEK